ncbi:unnamed protein product [Chironomus riparius]|uniref:Uncharacterized protein n=1 Tax=Chironomus riparius TaxID=315576 RepID=A0A9N9WYL3_9DIPT|nr:unnamed protein product [Chironomus riparius]
MKAAIMILFLFIFGSKSKAQKAQCEFSRKDFEITGITSKDSNFYVCELSDKQSIKRDHQEDLSDNNVRLLHILKNSKLETFSQLLCSKFPNLEVIWTENAAIKSIDQSSFKYCGQLEYLEMNGNKIQEIPPGTFSFQNKLRELSLENNKIKTLHSDSFDQLENVRTLSLASNDISDLPENVFVPFKRLLSLNLNNNKLTTIHADSFRSHVYFESVYLYNNQINSLDPQIGSKVPAINLDIQLNNCASSLFNGRVDIKLLKKCFDNYKPRESRIA